ncbi:MAG TPA: hypothetical protein VHE55_15215 [Fimbriimonadaceae bacterium]|nr:hypothetical protein [Fimbriimonadaceae bacterium]
MTAIGQENTLSNFNVTNDTGQTANDFEIFLTGIPPIDLVHFYTGSYPNYTVLGTPTTTIVRWTGGTTAPGAVSHFGVTITNAAQPSGVAYNWTFNGQPIGPLPSTWQGWNFQPGVRQDIIRNYGTTPIAVQRRWLVFTGNLQLEDLVRGGPIWNEGHILDTGFKVIPGGGTLTFNFPISSATADWYVMMYDLTDATSGRILMTFLNAAQSAGPGGQAAKKPGKVASHLFQFPF